LLHVYLIPTVKGKYKNCSHKILLSVTHIYDGLGVAVHHTGKFYLVEQSKIEGRVEA